MSAALCKKSLQAVPCGSGPAEIAHGTDLYALIFDKHPDLRHYFKGHENMTGAEVKTCEHFKKQGQTLLGACHQLAEKLDNTANFKAYCDEIIDRHVKINVHLDPKLWNAFWPIFLDFLATKTAVDDATKKAWLDLGKQFSDECLAHLKAIGQPH